MSFRLHALASRERALLILTLVVLGLLPVVGAGSSLMADKPDAKPTAKPDLSNQIVHDIDYSIVITAPANCKKLAVWLPLPPTTTVQKIEESRLTTFPIDVTPQIETESVFGNRFAYFEFKQPAGGLIIRHQFRATIHQANWNVDPSRIETVNNWSPEFAPYFKLSTIEDATAFNATLEEIGAQGPRASDDLFAAMDWIDQNLSYSHEKGSMAADPNHAFAEKTGHCSDYHGLCAEMGRRMGLPGRVVYGLCLYPKSSPSHCKLEVYLPGYEWVVFDLSETQKLVQRIQGSTELTKEEKERLTDFVRSRLKTGFRENSWLEVTRGTNYELAPKASAPVKLIRTIYAEADGVPLRDPDPTNPTHREFAWMTVLKFSATPPFKPAYPTGDLRAIDPVANAPSESTNR